MTEAVTFSGESYMMYRVIVPMQRRLHLQLDVKTLHNNGKLMVVQGDVDYSILEVTIHS